MGIIRLKVLKVLSKSLFHKVEIAISDMEMDIGIKAVILTDPGDLWHALSRSSLLEIIV